MPDELTQAEIEELKRLDKAATPGPWRHGFDNGSGTSKGDSSDHGGWILHPKSTLDQYATVISGGRDTWQMAEGVHEPADADLIAATRNALPKLLAMIDAQRWRQVSEEMPPEETRVEVWHADDQTGWADTAELCMGSWFSHHWQGEVPLQLSDWWRPLTPPPENKT